MAVLRNGMSYPQDLNPGVGMDDQYTFASNFADFGSSDMSGMIANPIDTTSVPAPKVSTLWYLFAVILLIVAFKFAVEHEHSGMQLSFVGIGVWNFVAVGILSFLFIVLLKVVFNKYHVDGLTELINVV